MSDGVPDAVCDPVRVGEGVAVGLGDRVTVELADSVSEGLLEGDGVPVADPELAPERVPVALGVAAADAVSVPDRVGVRLAVSDAVEDPDGACELVADGAWLTVGACDGEPVRDAVTACEALPEVLWLGDCVGVLLPLGVGDAVPETLGVACALDDAEITSVTDGVPVAVRDCVDVGLCVAVDEGLSVHVDLTAVSMIAGYGSCAAKEEPSSELS